MSDSVRPHRRQPIRLPVPGILQARTLEWVAISFSIASYWRNANQNYNDISPHTGRNGYHQKNPQTTNAGEVSERRELTWTVGGNIFWYTQYGEQYGGSLEN